MPEDWRHVAFQTSCNMFADFVMEVILRIKFWQNVLRHNAKLPAVWLSAFYDPNHYLNSLV